jgi:hypothetical protein
MIRGSLQDIEEAAATAENAGSDEQKIEISQAS